MSRGISWRQRSMLEQLLRKEEAHKKERYKFAMPVAWLELDYGPTKTESHKKTHTANGQWNIEQAMRRALRNLKQRGLVKLGRYVFLPLVENRWGAPHMEWVYLHPEQHIPGQTRIITGVLLTDRGRRVAREDV